MRLAQADALALAHLHQLIAPVHERAQVLPFRRARHLGRQGHRRTVAGQHHRIDPVRLGQEAGGSRELARLARIGPVERLASRMQMKAQCPVVAAGRLQHTKALLRLHEGGKGRMALVVIGKAASPSRRMEEAIQPVFGHVDPDETRCYGHGARPYPAGSPRQRPPGQLFG